ncbi:MAG: metal-dependent hydrolase, partial [Planctomycetota bacterium]
MSLQLTWLGHASWLIETDAHRILLDPFFADNPSATVMADQFADVSHVLVSHGHFDHIGDVAAVLETSGATLICNFEIAQWFAKEHGVEAAVGMNLGGQTQTEFGSIKLLPALHSSSLPDGSYGGTAGGFLIQVAGRRLYFACDTALFSDMKRLAHGVDVAILPIGDLFTMGIEDSIEAIKLIEPK